MENINVTLYCTDRFLPCIDMKKDLKILCKQYHIKCKFKDVDKSRNKEIKFIPSIKISNNGKDVLFNDYKLGMSSKILIGKLDLKTLSSLFSKL